jgi:hypothetical protein
VRHFDYDLERYRGDAQLPEQSILALARTALFDPALPFTIVEGSTRFRRDPQAPVAVVYAGRFADLQRSGAALEYAQSMAIPLEPRGADNVAAAHYWVLSEPNALLHPDPRQPIVMTNFGQTHGTEERRVIVDLLRLPYLKNELVIQIELDGLSATVRRDLLSTTRDRLKRGARYTALIEAIVDALGDDPELQAANTRRRLQLLDIRRDVSAPAVERGGNARREQVAATKRRSHFEKSQRSCAQCSNRSAVFACAHPLLCSCRIPAPNAAMRWRPNGTCLRQAI